MLSRQALLRSVRHAAPSRAILSQTRSFASPASIDKVKPPMAVFEKVKPPVAVYGVDGTYATALYTAAVKTSSLDSTAKAIASLGDIFAKDPKLPKILQAPTLTPADKNAIIAELEKAAGIPPSEKTVKNFLQTLAENNRLALLGSICAKFNEIISGAKGEVEMVVTSAQQLDNKILNRLETAVSKSNFVGQGKKLKVKNQVKPEIIGGLVVEIGDRTIDLSVSSKVAKMNKLLMETL